MDKSPAFFQPKSSVIDRNIAYFKALLHMVRIHEGAKQFARVDFARLSPELRDMAFESDKSLRHRSSEDFSPLYDDHIATLLAVAGVTVKSRDRFKFEVNDAIEKLQRLDL